MVTTTSLDDHRINLKVYKAAGHFFKMLPDYCNDWTYAGPIIQENHISIEPDFGGYPGTTDWAFLNRWIADSTNSEEEILFVNENPLRAAMLVYLEIKDLEK